MVDIRLGVSYKKGPGMLLPLKVLSLKGLEISDGDIFC